MTSLDIELAVAQYYDILPEHGGMGSNRNMLIPNFCGMNIPHECDLLRVTESGYAHEIEIKVSRADLLRDKKKRKHKPGQCYSNDIIRSLTFAIPDTLYFSIPDIPERAGVILVDEHGKCKEHRPARITTYARKLTDAEIMHLGKLASMRIWTLKRKLKGEAK